MSFNESPEEYPDDVGKTHNENAQRLRRETDEALRTPLPSMLKVKLLVNDLVYRIVEHAVALDALEKRLERLEKNLDA